MSSPSIVLSGPAYPSLAWQTAGSLRRAHTRLLPHGRAQAFGLVCRVGRAGARRFPVSSAAGGGAVGDAFVIEGTTNVKFPRELRIPGHADPLVILGTGYRDKFFVKVYAAAFYVDYSLGIDTAQWKEKAGIEIYDASSIFDSIFKEMLMARLL